MSDYYKILGISPDATFDQIRKAYRQKAKMLHPDVNRNKDSKISFQLLNEAYHILINRDKRKFYDIKIKYNREQYKRYGMNYENKNKNFHETGTEGYDFRKKRETAAGESKLRKKFNAVTDNFFFIIMLIIGLAALVFGIRDLFFTKWKGIHNLTGLIFGISYLCLLIYGWYLRSRTSKRNMHSGIN